MDFPLYFFLHIPKTGGTTVCWHLRQYLEDSFIRAEAPIVDNPEAFFRALPPERIDGSRVIGGHGVSSSVAAWVPQRERRFVTVLRDPSARVISQYNWRVYCGEVGKTSAPPPFEQWFTRDRHNGMAAWIVSRCQFGARRLPPGYDKRRLLADAHAILRQFWLVGTCEQLEPTLNPWFRALNVPVRFVKSKRVSGRDHSRVLQRTPEVEELVRRYSTADIALYHEFCESKVAAA